MTKSFPFSLAVASLLIAAAGPAAFAKATIIPGQNNGSFAAACERSKTCINWGSGVYTNGDTGVICNDKKCVKVPDLYREGTNGRGANNSGGSTGNPDSMGGDSGPAID